MDAGPADLDEVVADGGQRAEVELALGVEAARDGGAFRGKQSVGADDLLALLVDDEEVVAVGVEGVDVQAGLGVVEAGAEFPGEDLVAQPLGGPYLVLVAGEPDGVPGAAGAVRSAGSVGARGTAGAAGRVGGARGDGDRGAMVMAAPDPGTESQAGRLVAWLLYFFRDRLDST